MKAFKYSMAVLAGMLIIVGNAFALEVTSPNGGETWIIGSTHTITWNYSGPDRQLKLELFKGGVWVGTIVENIPAGQKTYQWKVGEYIGGRALSGTDYKIRAKMMYGVEADRSNSSFTLANVLGLPPLQEKKPKFQEQKPKLQEQKPKMEVRKPNLKCSVEAYYDSNCTQKIPFTGDSYQYVYQTAPSPKFIYFLIKIKNLGGPVNEPIYCMSGIFISSSRNYNTQGYLSGLGADEEIRMQPLSWRIEESDRGVTTIEAFMQISGKGYGEPHECYHGTTCTCHVEIK